VDATVFSGAMYEEPLWAMISTCPNDLGKNNVMANKMNVFFITLKGIR